MDISSSCESHSVIGAYSNLGTSADSVWRIALPITVEANAGNGPIIADRGAVILAARSLRIEGVDDAGTKWKDYSQHIVK